MRRWTEMCLFVLSARQSQYLRRLHPRRPRMQHEQLTQRSLEPPQSSPSGNTVSWDVLQDTCFVLHPLIKITSIGGKFDLVTLRTGKITMLLRNQTHHIAGTQEQSFAHTPHSCVKCVSNRYVKQVCSPNTSMVAPYVRVMGWDARSALLNRSRAAYEICAVNRSLGCEKILVVCGSLVLQHVRW